MKQNNQYLKKIIIVHSFLNTDEMQELEKITKEEEKSTNKANISIRISSELNN
jgi:hypothetical protein